MGAVIVHLKDANIVVIPVVVHIEMGLVAQHVLEPLRHEGKQREDNPAVEITLVKILGKRSDNIGKTARLDKWHALRRNKNDIFHVLTSWQSNAVLH